MPQKSVYVAPVDRIDELKSELSNIHFIKDNFVIANGNVQGTFWAQNIWQDAKVVKIESIKKAAQLLKDEQRNWWHYPLNCVRRTKLIQESLPKIKAGTLDFPYSLPQSPLGAFALLSENEMIYSPNCTAIIPNGEFNFTEPTYKTPSEAYKKLWEALVRLGSFPQKGELCVDLGSSPGSWTQALLELGANVVSVDKALLDIPKVDKYTSRLSFLKKDAFKIDPNEILDPVWIFSDIICFPDKLYDLALKWKAAHPTANFVFTIKFQGKWDRDTVKKFAKIPNSSVAHLFNNKHELCWMNLAK